MFSLLAIVILLLIVVMKILTRNDNKMCQECLNAKRKNINWDKGIGEDVIVDSDDESDLSDDE